jgi:hypothetical protein
MKKDLILTNIHNSPYNDFILTYSPVTLISVTFLSTVGLVIDSYHTSGTKRGRRNEYYWNNGTEQMNITDPMYTWKRKEPDDEKCLRVLVDNTIYWMSSSCNDKRGVICEF